MGKYLTKYGIEFCEIERAKDENEYISASRVRKLLKEEIDRDGAFAITVSSIEKNSGTYSDTHKLVVFHNSFDGFSDRKETLIYSQIVRAMDELEQVKI